MLSLFRRDLQTEQAPKPAPFFCIYCNAKFPHDDLPRVVAHLKPHRSKEEAEARIAHAREAEEKN